MIDKKAVILEIVCQLILNKTNEQPHDHNFSSDSITFGFVS